MNDPVVIELRALRNEIAALRDEVQQLHLARPQITPLQRELLTALGDVFGAGPLRTKQIFEAMALDIGERPRLRAALTAMGATTAQRAGMALRSLADKSGSAGGWRISRPASERGSSLWCLEQDPVGDSRTKSRFGAGAELRAD